MRSIAIPLCAAIVTVLAACQTAPAATKATPAPETPVAPQLSDTERDVANLAIDALAAESGIPKDRITVQSVNAVDWGDSSLGCAKPDRAYLSVVTPGHRIILLADGKLHNVHEANNRAFVCRQTRLVAPAAPPTIDLTSRKQMLQARKDLATRLSVPEAEIGMGAITPTTWVDASLGCPEPGTQYAQVETEGWLLVLIYKTREYTYHADTQRVIPCPAIAAY